MQPFELLKPKSFPEAIALLESGSGESKSIAGGTALMLMMKSGVFSPAQLISLRGISDSAYITAGSNGELKIGALTTLSALEHSTLIMQHAPIITRAMKSLANVRVRNVATIGGALSHGDPHMDMPPILCALGAQIHTIGPNGQRTIPVDQLYLGYYETCLEPNELIDEIIIPSGISLHSAYVKCTTRSADDWPALGVAACLNIQSQKIESSRIFLGSISDTPIRLLALESRLANQEISISFIEKACALVENEVDPVSDHLGTADYKRVLAKVYTKRALLAALKNGDYHVQ